ncbi:hypothetical protein CYMTET_48997, partial [Cymbomonas tetramitiformis]
TRFHYSTSIDVLGRLIEAVTGGHLEDVVRERVTAPLAMHDTSFVLPEEKLHRFAACYRHMAPASFEFAEKNNIGVSTADTPWLEGGEMKHCPSGGGGMLSTSNDFMRFAEMLARGGELEGVRILHASTVQMMRADQIEARGAERSSLIQHMQGFGLGTSLILRPGEKSAFPCLDAGLGTGGWGGAAGTYFFVDPVNHISAVFTTQILGYSEACPDLRTEGASLIYSLFPRLAKGSSSGGQDSLASGFTG